MASKMIVNVYYLSFIGLFFLHKTEAKCSQRLVSYWERHYRKNYFGVLEPWDRCRSEQGTCLRKYDTCESGDWVRYQTTCDNRCDCCFRKKRISKELDWVLVKKRLTWEEARDDCRKDKNGDLAVPGNVADLIKYIKRKRLGTADVWLGINDKFNGEFEGIYGNEVLGGWLPGQPERQTQYKDNCVVVEDASSRGIGEGMKVEPCWAKNYYVCDVNRNSRRNHDVTYTPSKSTSDHHVYEEEDQEEEVTHIAYGDNIEIFADRKTWQEARAACKEREGDLLVPRSLDDLLHFMEKIGIEERDIWLGFSDHYTHGEYDGIHGNKIPDDTLWQRGQPVPQDLGNDCVSIENDALKGAGLKVKPCHRKLLYACDMSDHFKDSHDIEH